MEFRSIDILGYRVLIQVLPTVKTLSVERINTATRFILATPAQAENRAYHELFDSAD